jgi:dipeptidyl aminopeptidase/acylaminoacyl peptidase
MLFPDDFMLIPDENTPERPVREYQVAARAGCSRRTFLIGGTLAALAGGVSWWAASRFFHSQLQPAAVPVDKHRIFNFPLTAYSPDLEYAWLPDSRHIACVTQSEIFLVDVESGKMVWKQDLPSPAPSSPNTLLVHWSPDGKRVIVVGEREIYAQDLIPGGMQIVWPGPSQFFLTYENEHEQRVAFSPDETLLAMANPEVSASVGIWNIQEGRQVAECQIAQGFTLGDQFDMAWAPDGASLAVYTGSARGISSLTFPALTLWRTSDGHLLWASSLTDPGNNDGTRPGRIKWSPDGSAVAYTYTTSLATYTTRLTVLDAKTGAIHFQTPMASFPFIQIPQLLQSGNIFAWSPDSTRLAFLIAENGRPGIQMCDALTGQLLFTCQSVQEQPGTLFWSPDGRYLVADTLQFWDGQSGEALFSYTAPLFAERLLWSPDSHFLAVHTTTSRNCQQVAWGRTNCTATFALQVFQVR